MNIDGKIEAYRIAGAGAGVTIWSLTLNEWVAAITIFYLFIQIIILAPKALRVLHVIYRRISQ